MFQLRVGHGRTAPGQRLHPVRSLGDVEADVLQDAAGHLADHPAVIDDKAGLHGAAFLFAQDVVVTPGRLRRGMGGRKIRLLLSESRKRAAAARGAAPRT
jgi:hypothetical protein